MQAWQQVVGAWRRWRESGGALGVDDDGSCVRWVGLRRDRHGVDRCWSAGQWPLGVDEGGGVGWRVPGWSGRSMALALQGGVCVRRLLPMPEDLAPEDHSTWARVQAAQAMGLALTDVSVDWGAEDAQEVGNALWLVAARADAVMARSQWAANRGGNLTILDTQCGALERVMWHAVQGQTDPVWLWWAGRDEGRLCTAWWHQGQWSARQDVVLDVGRLHTMPQALGAMVCAAQAHQPPIERLHWWWAGEPLAAWAERWNQQALTQGQNWLCRPVPVPFAREIDALGQGPAHRWALALGLALHPDWRGA